MISGTKLGLQARLSFKQRNANDRILRDQNARKWVVGALLQTIDITDQQILYLKLLTEDQWNPFLDITRAVKQN